MLLGSPRCLGFIFEGKVNPPASEGLQSEFPFPSDTATRVIVVFILSRGMCWVCSIPLALLWAWLFLAGCHIPGGSGGSSKSWWHLAHLLLCPIPLSWDSGPGGAP